MLIWAAAAAADRDLTTSILGLQLLQQKILHQHEAQRLGKNLGLEVVAVLSLFVIIIIITAGDFLHTEVRLDPSYVICITFLLVSHI